MTEAEWLASDDPAALLRHLDGGLSERKLRLFACACARFAWGSLRDKRSREAVEMVERRLERPRRAPRHGRAEELANQAQYDVWLADGGSAGSPVRSGAWSATLFALWATKDSRELRVYYLENAVCMEAAPPAGVQAELLRDVAGNPFRPAAVDGGWRTATVVALAVATYEEREVPSGELDVERLAILADALEDAGCADETILAHLRSPGPHVRGCWVVDLILGRE